MQIKAVRHQLTAEEKSCHQTDHKWQMRPGRAEGALLRCWWGCKLVQPLWETVWSFLKKLKMGQLYDTAILFLGIYLKKMKTLIQKDTCTSMFVAALLTIAKIWRKPKCLSTNEWIKKIWHVCVCVCVCVYIYIYIWMLFSHKKEWNFAIYRSMDGSWRHFAKWNKSDRERQTPCYLTCEI